MDAICASVRGGSPHRTRCRDVEWEAGGRSRQIQVVQGLRHEPWLLHTQFSCLGFRENGLRQLNLTTGEERLFWAQGTKQIDSFTQLSFGDPMFAVMGDDGRIRLLDQALYQEAEIEVRLAPYLCHQKHSQVAAYETQDKKRALLICSEGGLLSYVEDAGGWRQTGVRTDIKPSSIQSVKTPEGWTILLDGEGDRPLWARIDGPLDQCTFTAPSPYAGVHHYLVQLGGRAYTVGWMAGKCKLWRAGEESATSLKAPWEGREVFTFSKVDVIEENAEQLLVVDFLLGIHETLSCRWKITLDAEPELVGVTRCEASSAGTMVKEGHLVEYFGKLPAEEHPYLVEREYTPIKLRDRLYPTLRIAVVLAGLLACGRLGQDLFSDFGEQLFSACTMSAMSAGIGTFAARNGNRLPKRIRNVAFPALISCFVVWGLASQGSLADKRACLYMATALTGGYTGAHLLKTWHNPKYTRQALET